MNMDHHQDVKAVTAKKFLGIKLTSWAKSLAAAAALYGVVGYYAVKDAVPAIITQIMLEQNIEHTGKIFVKPPMFVAFGSRTGSAMIETTKGGLQAFQFTYDEMNGYMMIEIPQEEMLKLVMRQL